MHIASIPRIIDVEVEQEPLPGFELRNLSHVEVLSVLRSSSNDIRRSLSLLDEGWKAGEGGGFPSAIRRQSVDGQDGLSWLGGAPSWSRDSVRLIYLELGR